MSTAPLSWFPIVAAVLCSMLSTSRPKPTGLRLDAYSEEHIKGCYIHNFTLGVCFEARKDSIKITKTSGEEIVLYRKLGHDKLFYKIMDQGFIGQGSKMIYISGGIPRMPQELREYPVLKQAIEGTPSEREAVKTHYQRAVSELYNVREIQLLEIVSKALSDNSTQPEILKPFHVLCFSLFKTASIETSARVRVAHDKVEETEEPNNRQKRACRSLEMDPDNNECLGMCGKGCRCWSWICSDCCFHSGCRKHDLCCRQNFWSSYCLTPFLYEFTCNDYPGYLDCLNEK